MDELGQIDPVKCFNGCVIKDLGQFTLSIYGVYNILIKVAPVSSLLHSLLKSN